MGFCTTVELDGGKQGIFLAGSYGYLKRHDIPTGRKLSVAAGLFFACHSEQSLSCEIVGGLKNYCCGTKAICLGFEGPCTVYTQSRNPNDLRRMMARGGSDAGGTSRDADGDARREITA